MKRNWIITYKPVGLGLSIFQISKIVMNKILYDYMKPNMEKKAKLCYMDKGSFIVYIRTEDIYIDIAKNVEIRFETSNYELERPLLKGRNKTK